MVLNEFTLIEVVHANPVIWDSNSIQFRDKNLKQQAWNSVAVEVGDTGKCWVGTELPFSKENY